jgi:hypothetical protein
MKTILIDALPRAFGMVVFAVVFLWFSHRSFPGNWLGLAVLYLACIPFAALYGWLAGPQLDRDIAPSRRHVPGLVLIALATAAVIFGYALFKARVDSFFYPGHAMTSNKTIEPTR